MKKASTIMTTKKYVITFIIFALLSVLTLTLFFGGLFIKEHSLIAFYILIAFSCISFVFSIIFIAINYKELVNYDIKKLNNINLIDIRSIEKYNNRHIPSSFNIPLEKMLIGYNKYLDKHKKYYIYCQKGIQSRKLCQILKNNGYNVVNIIGGYEAWVLSE